MRSLTAEAAKKKKKAAKSEDFRLSIVCDADTLRSLVRKKAVRVVDVRKVDDYQKGHIPTAVSLPLAHVLENDAP
jgi:thiosulfate/3-mercaptopyruvate sulfurtransferase